MVGIGVVLKDLDGRFQRGARSRSDLADNRKQLQEELSALVDSKLKPISDNIATRHWCMNRRKRADLPPGTSPLSKLDLGPFEVHSMV